MSPTLTGLLVGFLLLLVVFRALELFRPKVRRMAVLRRGFWTDLVYWGFTPIVTREVTRIGVGVDVVPQGIAGQLLFPFRRG